MPHDQKRATRIVHVLNAASVVAFVASFAAKAVSSWMMLPALLLPVIATLIAFRFRPLIRLDRGQRGAGPHLALCLGLSSLSTGAFGLYAPLLDTSGLAWGTSACFAASYFVCARRIDGQNDKLTLAFLVFAGGCYGYGLAIATNMLLDTSEPRMQEAPIVDKWVRTKSRGGSDHELHVTVPNTQGVEIDVVVSSEEYERCRPGQLVVLRVHQGSLGMRWFEVARTCIEANGAPHSNNMMYPRSHPSASASAQNTP